MIRTSGQISSPIQGGYGLLPPRLEIPCVGSALFSVPGKTFQKQGWFTIPRFAVAHPEIQIKDELYEGRKAAQLLSDRTYDLIVTPEKIQSHDVESQPFLSD